MHYFLVLYLRGDQNQQMGHMRLLKIARLSSEKYTDRVTNLQRCHLR